MAGEEVPDKVKRANDIRYREYVKIIKIERKLWRKIQEDRDPRPDVPELVLPPGTIEGHARGHCVIPAMCDPCKDQDCGRCSSCHRD